MNEIVRELENKHRYLYKMKIRSKSGKNYWRYYSPRWKEGPVISRVKLNPEQAVLLCCDLALISKQSGSNNRCHATSPCIGSHSSLAS